MNILFVSAAITTVYLFDLTGAVYPVNKNQEVAFQQPKLGVQFTEPVPWGSIKLIDSKGHDVVLSVDMTGEVAVLYLKAKTSSGFPCGLMTLRAAGVEPFSFRVQAHHGLVCEEHKH